MIKVVIVDDVPEQQDIIKDLIQLDPEIKVVGCASNGIEVLKVCDEFKPDLVLMDLAMPICNGVIGSRLLKNTFPTIKILILTGYGNDEGLQNALHSGADGYLLKGVAPEILITTIKSTLFEEPTIGPEVLIP